MRGWDQGNHPQWHSKIVLLLVLVGLYFQGQKRSKYISKNNKSGENVGRISTCLISKQTPSIKMESPCFQRVPWILQNKGTFYSLHSWEFLWSFCPEWDCIGKRYTNYSTSYCGFCGTCSEPNGESIIWDERHSHILNSNFKGRCKNLGSHFVCHSVISKHS